MLPIHINFNAFIPKSLGKTLLSYFENDARFNPKVMPNYAEFRQKLIKADSHGFKWLEEPAHFATDYYCSTDTVDFHDKECSNNHTKRLSIAMQFDIAKIGNYSFLDSASVFKHTHGKINDLNQHSDESHRVEAFIRTVPIYYGGSKTGSIPTRIQYEGICKDALSATSKEIPLKTSIKNTLSGVYFHRVGTRVPNDSIVFEVAASAGYPFTPGFATPNIDFNLKITLHLNGKSLRITINGEHNNFPAYELVVDGKVDYKYKPTDNGPNHINLSKSMKFSRTVYKQLSDWDLRQIESLNHSSFQGKSMFGR